MCGETLEQQRFGLTGARLVRKSSPYEHGAAPEQCQTSLTIGSNRPNIVWHIALQRFRKLEAGREGFEFSGNVNLLEVAMALDSQRESARTLTIVFKDDYKLSGLTGAP